MQILPLRCQTWSKPVQIWLYIMETQSAQWLLVGAKFISYRLQSKVQQMIPTSNSYKSRHWGPQRLPCAFMARIHFWNGFIFQILLTGVPKLHDFGIYVFCFISENLKYRNKKFAFRKNRLSQEVLQNIYFYLPITFVSFGSPFNRTWLRI